MPDLSGTSRAQTIFLRAFRSNPFGPPPDQWPSPAVLRRWLRRPAFRAAMYTVRAALAWQSDHQLAAASAHAASALAANLSMLATTPPKDPQSLIHDLV